MNFEVVLSDLDSKSQEFEGYSTAINSLVDNGKSELNSISGTEISGLYSQVSEYLEKLENGYSKCQEWLTGYVNDLNSLESNLAGFNCANIDTPRDFEIGFNDIFSKSVIPTLQPGGDDRANLSLGDKGFANNLNATSGQLENARLGDEGAPAKDGYFLPAGEGGFNPFPIYHSDGGIGNCTYYAYSRFSELMGGEASTLSHGDACSWYNDSYGYKKGQEPRLGAIAVWQYGNDDSMGHVAVVEAIDEDGNIHTSEGGWSSECWYRNGVYYKDNGYATGYSDGHLLGFIYPEKE